MGYDPKNPKLRVLHAWGRSNRAGLYKEIARQNGLRFLRVGDIPAGEHERSSALANYAFAVQKLLEEARAKNHHLKLLFDVILVDEGQDLVFEERYKFEGKQPFYWMCYQSLRPVQNLQGALFEDSDSEAKRLIWAYDEAQSLDSLVIPTAKELFGEGFAKMVQGTYFGGIRKSEIMKSCYRTPGPILVAAHALGMGLLRPQGVVSSITTREGWEEIGYEVEGRFNPPGSTVRLQRLEEFSPNPIPKLWEQSVLTFNRYPGRFEEVEAIAERIKNDLEEGFKPSRDLLVVILGREFHSLGRMVAQALGQRQIDFYVPKASSKNSFDQNGDAGDFWHEGAVTLSSVIRAKGNEAEVVYVLGLDRIAEHENSPEARNQLFVALTRSRAFAHLSGVGNHPLYDEVEQVISSGSTFSFVYRKPKREIAE